MATRTCLSILFLSLFFMQSTYSIQVSNQLFREKRTATQLKSQTFRKISISLECITSNTIASTVVVPNPVTHLKYVLINAIRIAEDNEILSITKIYLYHYNDFFFFIVKNKGRMRGLLLDSWSMWRVLF